MKKIFFILIIVIIASPIWANQQKLEKALILLADSLSKSYSDRQPGVFKLNISIGEISNDSPRAKKLQMGQAVRDLFLKIFSRSNIFSVIDRTAMEEILKEQELQLSGITDGSSAVEIGGMLNAQVILYGSVSEFGDAFIVNCSLVDVESGEVISDQATVKADIISDAAGQRLDMMYVQPMGVGLSLSAMGINVTGNDPTIVPFPEEDQTIFRRNFSLEVRYRITSWLMASLGAEYSYGQLYHLDNVGLNSDFVTAYTFLYGPTSIPAILAVGGTLPFNIVGEGFTIPAKLSFVWTPVRWLNLSASAGVNYHIMDCSGYFSPSNGLGFGVNEYGPSIHKEFISISAMAGIEMFVSPRLAFQLNAGYEYGVFELISVDDYMITNFLEGIPTPLDIDISGFSLAARVSVYF